MKVNREAFVTVLWGLSNGEYLSVRAEFGNLTMGEMVAKQIEHQWGAGNPPYTPYVLRVFKFTGADAEKVLFLQEMSGKHRNYRHYLVFAELATDMACALLIKSKHKKHQHPRRILAVVKEMNTLGREVEMLKACEGIPRFNFWGVFRRFLKQVQAEVEKDRQAFTEAMWSEKTRNQAA